MFTIRNIFQNKGMTFSRVIAFQYRRFRTSGYLTSASNQKAIIAHQKFKLKQAKMQSDDGLPTYLKCGLRDKILFNVTLILLILEALDVARTVVQLRKNY